MKLDLLPVREVMKGDWIDDGTGSFCKVMSTRVLELNHRGQPSEFVLEAECFDALGDHYTVTHLFTKYILVGRQE